MRCCCESTNGVWPWFTGLYTFSSPREPEFSGRLRKGRPTPKGNNVGPRKLWSSEEGRVELLVVFTTAWWMDQVLP